MEEIMEKQELEKELGTILKNPVCGRRYDEFWLVLDGDKDYNGKYYYIVKLWKGKEYFYKGYSGGTELETHIFTEQQRKMLSEYARILQAETKNFILKRTCMCARNTTFLILTESQFDTYIEYCEWGTPLNNMRPELNPMEREILISGLCPTCQKEVFGKRYPSKITFVK